MRNRIPALALSAAVLLSGCYRVTVLTGAPEAPTPAVTKPWQNSFVLGLVPPPELDVRQQCPQGVAKVVSERNFLNGLVGAITNGIYTPTQVQVTCATGPVAR